MVREEENKEEKKGDKAESFVLSEALLSSPAEDDGGEKCKEEPKRAGDSSSE